MTPNNIKNNTKTNTHSASVDDGAESEGVAEDFGNTGVCAIFEKSEPEPNTTDEVAEDSTNADQRHESSRSTKAERIGVEVAG